MRLAPLSSIAFACLLALASEARANDVTFTGFVHGSETVSFSVTDAANVTTTGAAAAGGFATIFNGSPSFETYCVDVYQHIAFNAPPYSEYSAPGTTHVFANNRAYADLGRLYANVGPIDTSVKEAAFQIAVWEIAYETMAGPYSLGGGKASFSGGTADSSGALTLAGTWLAGLGNGAGRAINVIESADHQDVIYAPVPEPSTYMLMVAGLLATAEISRRKRRQA